MHALDKIINDLNLNKLIIFNYKIKFKIMMNKKNL